MSPLQRLKALFAERGLDDERFAQTVGIAPKEFVALAKQNRLPEHAKERMEHTLGTRVTYILTGRGARTLADEGPKLRIVQIREELGLSQEKFAVPFGLTQAGQSAVERGEVPIRRMMALAIESVHGVRHQWLLRGEEPRFVRGRISEADKTHLDLLHNLEPIDAEAIKRFMMFAQKPPAWDGTQERRRADRRKAPRSGKK